MDMSPRQKKLISVALHRYRMDLTNTADNIQTATGFVNSGTIDMVNKIRDAIEEVESLRRLVVEDWLADLGVDLNTPGPVDSADTPSAG